ncbi:tyrosine--tRNA ligase [Candidatus Saccharibacteria bacterium]|nr:tyrosine--tRNA ligase [Candidatus Saccharibacteria bacterium]
MMKLSEELSWRGLINQTTYKNISDLDNQHINFYFGVDPSASSMTIGNLAAAMVVRHFINAGHSAYLLVGGATGVIGDPDGKKDERRLKTLDEINYNKAKISKQYRAIFDRQEFKIVDNYDWFKDIGYLDFLRDVGKHTSMTQLLGRDFVQQRLGEGGSGISYAEFSYSLMQGYDFLNLYRNHGVSLQLAGADQWGNCLAGVDLVRRIDGGEAHALSTPLVVNKNTGVKFGKSEDGAVWLDPELTSPYKFYQFWLNVDDDMAESLIKIYTLLDKNSVELIISKHNQARSERGLQKVLAREVTDLVHGAARRQSVERVTAVLFGKENFSSLSTDDISELANEIPVLHMGTVVGALVAAGVVASNGEAKRLISAGAISVNGSRIEEDMHLSVPSLIKKGKNSFILVLQ